ncbi:DUF2512 family protein [Bacillus thermotolerans]|uniref:Integral membrane protein n=1 Tax=Bacillus thermotolerans TaxID=1221996 RepID=A0A0F5I3D4_BACTR|nr:DUF2512 family protein [Bacillus thermotolerans]KKB40179.1 Integral membrane protein [Bacillus thermotolerans]
MRHLTAILIKFVAITAVLYLALELVMDGGVFVDALIMGAIVTVVSYVLGDLMVLPAAGNSVAVFGDIILSAILVWVLGMVFNNAAGVFVNALVISVVFAIAEWFFHIYMNEKVLVTRMKNPNHA